MHSIFKLMYNEFQASFRKGFKMLCCYLIILVDFVFSFGTASTISPSIVLYSEQNLTGRSLAVRGIYVPDLGLRDFDNQVSSICLNGSWILYNGANYNSKELDYGVEYFSGMDYCTNIRSLKQQVTSLRFVGSSVDINFPSITLYSEDYFQGKENYVTTIADNLDNKENKTQSLIVTGDASWKIFNQRNFEGRAICVHPYPMHPPMTYSKRPQIFMVPDIGSKYNFRGPVHSVIQADCY